MKARRHILAWLGLVIPTLAIGALAFTLLSREQQRLDEMASQSAAAQAQTVADNLDLIMAEIKDGVMQALQAASGPGDEQARLAELVKANPFVEDCYIWSPQKTGRYLQVKGPDKRAEDFMDLAHPPWKTRLREQDTMVLSQQEKEPVSATYQQLETGNYANAKINRQAIRDISQENVQSLNTLKQQAIQQRSVQVDPNNVDYSYSPLEDTVDPAFGWLTRRGGEPGWLAWYQLKPGGRVTGAVLNSDEVFMQLKGAFPTNNSGKALFFRLITPSDEVFYNGSQTYSGLSNTISIPVGSELPDWRLSYDGAALGSHKGFLLLGGLIVAVLCMATLGAGTLLLMQARRDAREAARKTTFVSNVSHELRTPLTTIRMYAEMLEDERVSELSKRQRYLSTISSESKRLTRLVDNVLDFSRLEQGKKQYHRESVDCAALIVQVLESQKPRLDSAGMHVEWSPPQESVSAHTDRDALEQVLINLVDNAIKYAAQGEVLAISLGQLGDTAQITVRDAGPGILARDAKKAFASFQRLDDSLTAAQAGSGLGLSICRSLLNGLGGKIALEDARPGCCFVIKLPASQL